MTFSRAIPPGRQADTLKTFYNVRVHPDAILKWVKKYSIRLYDHTINLPIITCERYCVDELYVRVRGAMKYLFAMTGALTRFCLAYEMTDCRDGHNAEELLQEAKKKAGGRVPAESASDAPSSYAQARREVYAAGNHPGQGRHPRRGRRLHQQQKAQQQRERFNGTVRSFLRPLRGIKNKDTSLSKRFSLLQPHTSALVPQGQDVCQNGQNRNQRDRRMGHACRQRGMGIVLGAGAASQITMRK